MNEIVILSEDEYAAFEESMSRPHVSSPTLVRGAELLRDLRNRKPHTPEPENAEDRIAQAKAKAMSDKCSVPEDD